MELSFDELYKDSCVIRRSKNTVTDGVEDFDTIMSSKCSLQVGSTGDSSLYKAYQTSSLIIMPFTAILLKINDKLEITTHTGRVIVGTIENYESHSIEDISGTMIWFKEGNG